VAAEHHGAVQIEAVLLVEALRVVFQHIQPGVFAQLGQQAGDPIGLEVLALVDDDQVVAVAAPAPRRSSFP
jgi:hypothetical protein